jgi:hypothetical protein
MYSLNALNGASSFAIKIFILISDYDRAHEIISDFIAKHEKTDEEGPSIKDIKTTAKALATGLFFFNMPQGTEEAVHGIMILPRVTGNE